MRGERRTTSSTSLRPTGDTSEQRRDALTLLALWYAQGTRGVRLARIREDKLAEDSGALQRSGIIGAARNAHRVDHQERRSVP